MCHLTSDRTVYKLALCLCGVISAWTECCSLLWLMSDLQNSKPPPRCICFKLRHIFGIFIKSICFIKNRPCWHTSCCAEFSLMRLYQIPSGHLCFALRAALNILRAARGTWKWGTVMHGGIEPAWSSGMEYSSSISSNIQFITAIFMRITSNVLINKVW